MHREFERVNATRHSVALDNCPFDHCTIFVLTLCIFITFSFVFTLCFVVAVIVVLTHVIVAFRLFVLNRATFAIFAFSIFLVTLTFLASSVLSIDTHSDNFITRSAFTPSVLTLGLFAHSIVWRPVPIS